MYIAAIVSHIPASIYILTNNASIFIQVENKWLCHLAVDSCPLIYHIVSAHETFLFISCVRYGLAICGIWQHTRPALFIYKVLLDSRCVGLRLHIKSGVIADVSLAIIINHGRTVTGCLIAHLKAWQIIVARQL